MAEERLMKDADKIALTDGGVTTLHSHPGGGGGGLVDKAGTVTTNAQGVASVVFNTAYGDTNYFIGFGVLDPGDATLVMVQNGTKAVGGFDVKTWDDGGKTEPNVTIFWFTGPYNNP